MLGWIKVNQWAAELALLLLIGCGVWYWHHEAIEKGVAEQVATDNAATAKLKQETAVQTAALKTKADTAEQAYDKEHQDLEAYRSGHPVQPVRLCNAPHDSNTFVPGSAGIVARNAAGSSAGIVIQQVPSGDSGSGAGRAGPDISQLLLALGARADDVSATLREYQARNK